jgi:hypothetical protein
MWYESIACGTIIKREMAIVLPSRKAGYPQDMSEIEVIGAKGESFHFSVPKSTNPCQAPGRSHLKSSETIRNNIVSVN